MRIMIAGLAAALALAFTGTASAQQEVPADKPATTKPSKGTAAYCNTLKSASSKSACLKRVQAQAKPAPMTQPPTSKAKAKAKAAPKMPTSAAPKTDTTASAPPLTPAPAPTSTVAVPPLPHRTI